VLDTLGGDDTVIVALPDGVSGPAAGIRVDTGAGSNNRLLVRGGSVRIDAISTGGTLDTTVLGNTQVSTSRLLQNGLTLGDTSRLTLLPSGDTSVITSLSIGAGATLDIGTGALVLDYAGDSPAATIRQQVVSGRGGTGLGAAWNGTGITSSAVAAANAVIPESRSVAYAENASLPLGPYTTFRGQAVDSTAILIAFAHTADANLDNLVNDDDVTILGASFAPGGVDAFWSLADFDYNGAVDDDDVTLLGVFYTPPPAAQAAPPSFPGAAWESRRAGTKLRFAAPPHDVDLDLISLLAASLAEETQHRQRKPVASSRIVSNFA
jgi:hypothetical protein